jgi:hypothetical protein
MAVDIRVDTFRDFAEKTMMAAPDHPRFDVISAMFLINYAVSDHASLVRFVEACRAQLSPSGVIVGTMVDSEASAKELLQSADDRVGKDYFRLTALPDQASLAPGDLGYMYEFFLHNCVDNCIEYTVPWADLEAEVCRQGMRVDYVLSFEADSICSPSPHLAMLHPAQRQLTGLYIAFQISLNPS